MEIIMLHMVAHLMSLLLQSISLFLKQVYLWDTTNPMEIHMRKILSRHQVLRIKCLEIWYYQITGERPILVTIASLLTAIILILYTVCQTN